MLKRASVLPASRATGAVVIPSNAVSSKRATVARRVVVQANEQANALIEAAQAQAKDIVADAEQRAKTLAHDATELGRAQAYAETIARVAVIGELEARADERNLERSMSLARLLAERLLGERLRSSDDTVVLLAQQALSEVKAARSVRLLANPEDAARLQEHLGNARSGFVVSPDATLARGDFRIVTDVGTLDARMNERLDLLASKLLASLKQRG